MRLQTTKSEIEARSQAYEELGEDAARARKLAYESHQQETKERKTALKQARRRDGPLRALLLYVPLCLLPGIAASTMGARLLAKLPPGGVTPGLSLALSALVGWIAGKLMALLSPRSARRGIVIGAMLFCLAQFIFYQLPRTAWGDPTSFLIPGSALLGMVVWHLVAWWAARPPGNK